MKAVGCGRSPLYVIYKEKAILIDSIYSNKIFYQLLLDKKVPGLENFNIIKTEPSYDKHRFDFLVSNNTNNYFIELKSCTLARGNIASFPDAISSRASAHIKNLARSGKGILVFLIFHQSIEYFLPNYHRDFSFYQALKENSDKIKMYAYSIVQNKSHEIISLKKVKIKIPERKPMGSYLLFLYNKKNINVEVGQLGKINFPEGFYIYTGSAMNNVFKRIQRHRHNQKAVHWHIDYIKKHMKIIYDIPIVNEKNIECQLAVMLADLKGKRIDGFGASDCSCEGHLVYFKNNPLNNEVLMNKILELWFNLKSLQ